MSDSNSTQPFIPYGRQLIDDTDIAAVVSVLKSDFLTQGPVIAEFEQKVAKFVGAKYAVACCNGTAALHIACQALGLGPGKTLATSPITFLASANCGEFLGATVQFIDIDSETNNISVQKLEQYLETKKLDVLIPVHFAGRSCDMQAIHRLQQKHGFSVVEDASHNIGGEYGGNKIGSCEFSDGTVFSFHPVKHITTAEGGMVTTNSKELYERMMRLRSHGMHKDSAQFQNKDLAFERDDVPNCWYYEMSELAHNYRVTDLQCALGMSQLTKIDGFIDRRLEIVAQYNEELKENPFLATPLAEAKDRTAFHLYVVQIDFEKLDRSRNAVMAELRERKVGTQVHYIPVHLQPYYHEKYGTKMGDFPQAEAYYAKCLSLPLFPAMTDEDVKYVISTINEVIA